MGFFSSVAKVFKKVVKTVKKILPFVVLAAAVVFTAGAALAALGPAAGSLGISAASGTGIFGWSTALTSAIGGVGGVFAGSPILASVVTGAITQGIIGTAIGGGLALLTGKDLTKGLLLGGISGLITGGVSGAFNVPAALPAPSTAGQTGLSAGGRAGLAGAGQATSGAGATVAGGPFAGAAPSTSLAGTASASLSGPGVAATAPSFSTGSGVAAAKGGVLERASVLGDAAIKTGLAPAATEVPFGDLSALGKLGRIVNSRVGSEAIIGGAKALLTGEDETGRVEAARITAEESRLSREQTAQNFSGAGGLLKPRSDAQSFVADPSLPLQAGRWFWNPQTRRLEFQAPALA